MPRKVPSQSLDLSQQGINTNHTNHTSTIPVKHPSRRQRHRRLATLPSPPFFPDPRCTILPRLPNTGTFFGRRKACLPMPPVQITVIVADRSRPTAQWHAPPQEPAQASQQRKCHRSSRCSAPAQGQLRSRRHPLLCPQGQGRRYPEARRYNAWQRRARTYFKAQHPVLGQCARLVGQDRPTPSATPRLGEQDPAVKARLDDRRAQSPHVASGPHPSRRRRRTRPRRLLQSAQPTRWPHL